MNKFRTAFITQVILILLQILSKYVVDDLKEPLNEVGLRALLPRLHERSHVPLIEWKKGVLYFQSGEYRARRFPLPLSFEL